MLNQRPQWTGNLICKMHVNRVSAQDIADELGIVKSYVSMILDGTRNPKGCQERFEAAYENIMAKRN